MPNTIELVNHPVLTTKSNLTACFTGPRPKNLHGYNSRDPYHKITNTVSELLGQLADRGVNHFISGGAQGFDQLAFWAVHSLARAGKPVYNEVYVPFPNQPTRWSKTGPFGLGDYNKMLAAASHIRYVNDNPADDSIASAARLLHARNHAMVANSDFVIALLSDRSLNWRTAKGGTAEAVRYAVAQKKPVLAIEYRPDSPEQYKSYWI